MTLERMSLRMPIIRVIEWPIPDRVRSRIDDSIYPLAAGEGRLSPCEAERCLTRVQELGFPMPTQVNLVQARTTHTAGQETGGMCLYIFAWSDSPEFLHRIFWHEYGHVIHKTCFTLEHRQVYDTLRFSSGGPSDAALIASDGWGEIFAEDFRLLFGTELARTEEHTRKLYVGDLGMSLPFNLQQTKVVKDGMTYIQWHEALRRVVRNAVNEWQTGRIILVDIEGHWAQEAILECVRQGLIRGYPDRTFRPDEPVTRAELAVVAARLANLVRQGT